MAFHALTATVLLQGISGLAGGYALLADPSGDFIGLPLAWLEGTPFSDCWSLVILSLSSVRSVRQQLLGRKRGYRRV